MNVWYCCRKLRVCARSVLCEWNEATGPER
jgi:hypothetical protein